MAKNISGHEIASTVEYTIHDRGGECAVHAENARQAVAIYGAGMGIEPGTKVRVSGPNSSNFEMETPQPNRAVRVDEFGHELLRYSTELIELANRMSNAPSYGRRVQFDGATSDVEDTLDDLIRDATNLRRGLRGDAYYLPN